MPDNLPAPLTSLVGRAEQAVEVAELLTERRLVTLVGAPGVGKTRLGLHVATQVAGSYADGVWLIDMAEVPEPSLVAQAVASVLSLRERPGESITQTIAAYVSGKAMLLVLDNCEHLASVCAEMTAALLSACRRLTVLTTSREALAVMGEAVWDVPPLAVPRDNVGAREVRESGAGQLFAARVPGGLRVTEAEARRVARICRRLDGLPLALELAANRVGELTLEELEARLDSPFELLGSHHVGLGSHHQTLHDSLEWSHEQLTDRERVLLRRLAVFAGSFDSDAVLGVCNVDGFANGGFAELLVRLAGRSLIARKSVGPRTQYRLHEAVRHFAREKLRGAGEELALCHAHAQWCAEAVDRADADGPHQAQRIAALGSSQTDLRAALAWSRDNDRELALRLSAGLSRFWLAHGHLSEGREWLEMALSDNFGPPALRARALWGAALMACLLGDFSVVAPAAEEALGLARQVDDHVALARLLNLLGVCRVFTDPPAALEVLGEAVGLAREGGETFTLVSSLGMLGFVQSLLGDLQSARRSLEEGVESGRRLGDSQPLVIALAGLGQVFMIQGDLARAIDLLDEALAVGRRVDDPLWVALTLTFRSELESLRGSEALARQLADEAVQVARQSRSAPVVGMCLAVAGQLELRADQPARALPLFEESLSLCRTGERGGIYTKTLVGLARTRMSLGDPDSAQLLLEETLLIAEHAKSRTAIADALYWLGQLAHARGDHERALELQTEALLLDSQTGRSLGIMASLEAIAALVSHMGDAKKAARLFGAADSLRASHGVVRSRAEQAAWEENLGVVEQQLGAQGRASAWSTGARLGEEGAVAYACRGRGSRRRVPSGWISLTPTELEVVNLVAEHLTNAEIGARLFMSPRTVQAHLTHVFRKMHLQSRRELAWEVERRRRGTAPDH